MYDGPRSWAEGQYYEVVKLEFTNGIDDNLGSSSSEAGSNEGFGVFNLALLTISAIFMALI